MDENINADEAKKVSQRVKEILDPIYPELAKVSKLLRDANVAGIQIGTPDGIFFWEKNLAERVIN